MYVYGTCAHIEDTGEQTADRKEVYAKKFTPRNNLLIQDGLDPAGRGEREEWCF